MSDEELMTAVDFVKGCYRLLVEIRDEVRAMRNDGTPTQAALPLDEDEGLPEPGGLAHAIAAAPRIWGSTVKFYNEAWMLFKGNAFILAELFDHREELTRATHGKVHLASFQRVMSALVRAGAATRKGGAYTLREPNDELRAAVEEARKGRRATA